ncbi:MAG: annexin, partial [Bdellovibrionales bacterium]|nr:annexin [Bdellovibrionales bacterium]
DMIFSAVDGIGTTEEAVKAAFDGKSIAELRLIRSEYNSWYAEKCGDANLTASLFSDYSFDEQDEIIARSIGDTVAIEAIKAKDAMDGAFGTFTDEEGLYSIFTSLYGEDLKDASVSLEKIHEFVRTYEELYGDPPIAIGDLDSTNSSRYENTALMRRIRSVFSGAEMDRAVALLYKDELGARVAQAREALDGVFMDEDAFWHVLDGIDGKDATTKQDRKKERIDFLVRYEQEYGRPTTRDIRLAEIRGGNFENSALLSDLQEHASKNGLEYSRAVALLVDDRVLAETLGIEYAVDHSMSGIKDARVIVDRILREEQVLTTLVQSRPDQTMYSSQSEYELALKEFEAELPKFRKALREVSQLRLDVLAKFEERNGVSLEVAIGERLFANKAEGRIVEALLRKGDLSALVNRLRAKEDSGELSTEEQHVLYETEAELLHDAIEGIGGTKEDVIISILSNKTESQLKLLREVYSNIPQWSGASLDEDLLSDVSGDRDLEVRQLLKGPPKTIGEMYERYLERYQHDREFIGDDIVLYFDQERGRALGSQHAQIEALIRELKAAGKYDQALNPAGATDEEKRLKILIKSASAHLDSVRETKAMVGDMTAEVLAIGGAVVVTICSAGSASPIAILILTAQAGGTALALRSGTKLLIKGNSYGIEEFGSDALRSAVDGAGMALGARGGLAIRKMIIKDVADRTGMAVAEKFFVRVAKVSIEGATDGAIGNALANATMVGARSVTWDNGLVAGIRRVLSSAGEGAAVGALAGGVFAGVFEIGITAVKSVLPNSVRSMLYRRGVGLEDLDPATLERQREIQRVLKELKDQESGKAAREVLDPIRERLNKLKKEFDALCKEKRILFREAVDAQHPLTIKKVLSYSIDAVKQGWDFAKSIVLHPIVALKQAFKGLAHVGSFIVAPIVHSAKFLKLLVTNFPEAMAKLGKAAMVGMGFAGKAVMYPLKLAYKGIFHVGAAIGKAAVVTYGLVCRGIKALFKAPVAALVKAYKITVRVVKAVIHFPKKCLTFIRTLPEKLHKAAIAVKNFGIKAWNAIKTIPMGIYNRVKAVVSFGIWAGKGLLDLTWKTPVFLVVGAYKGVRACLSGVVKAARAIGTAAKATARAIGTGIKAAGLFVKLAVTKPLVAAYLLGRGVVKVTAMVLRSPIVVIQKVVAVSRWAYTKVALAAQKVKAVVSSVIKFGMYAAKDLFRVSSRSISKHWNSFANTFKSELFDALRHPHRIPRKLVALTWNTATIPFKIIREIDRATGHG